MRDELLSRLAGLGIDVPGLEALPLAAGVTAAGFPSAGDQALEWWRRLRAVNEATGFWPVLIPSVDDGVSLGVEAGCPGASASRAVEAAPQQRLARAAALDGASLLNPPPHGTFQSQPDSVRGDMLSRWPDEPRRIDAFGLPYLRDGQPGRVLVALIEAAHGWQVPTLLGYGNWNTCPEPAVHGAVLRHWRQRHGAELVCMAHDGLELAVAQPPRTKEDALAFAWEYPRYCLDGMDLYEADDIPDLAACLIDAQVVRFWWD